MLISIPTSTESAALKSSGSRVSKRFVNRARSAALFVLIGSACASGALAAQTITLLNSSNQTVLSNGKVYIGQEGSVDFPSPGPHAPATRSRGASASLTRISLEQFSRHPQSPTQRFPLPPIGLLRDLPGARIMWVEPQL